MIGRQDEGFSLKVVKVMLLQQHGSNISFALKPRARVLLLKMQTHEEMS